MGAERVYPICPPLCPAGNAMSDNLFDTNSDARYANVVATVRIERCPSSRVRKSPEERAVHDCKNRRPDPILHDHHSNDRPHRCLGVPPSLRAALQSDSGSGRDSRRGARPHQVSRRRGPLKVRMLRTGYDPVSGMAASRLSVCVRQCKFRRLCLRAIRLRGWALHFRSS